MGKDLIVPKPPVMFRLFGAVEAHTDEGKRIDLGSEKERCLIVGLLLAKGRAISRLEILEWPWDSPPESADGDLERFMTRLRKRLEALGIKEMLVNRDRQCRLTVPPDWVDVHRFRDLVAKARSQDDDQQAAEYLGAALDLSEGEPLAGLAGRRVDTERRGLVEERRAVEFEFLQFEVALGRHRQHIPHLTRLCLDRPENPEVAGLTMYALHLAGRQPEALDVYQHHRRHLLESGLDVYQPLQELHQRILRGDLPPAGEDGFPTTKPRPPVQDEPATDKPPRAAKNRAKVVNKISGPVSGDNLVFGIQNRVGP